MNPASRTGWLFKGAELAGATADLVHPEGIVLTPAGRIAMVSGDEAIRQSIIMLLTTIPGERVMRPEYGCPLHRLMFAPNDATTAGLAIHYVRQALVRFEPRIDIVSLDATAAHVTVRGFGEVTDDSDGANNPEGGDAGQEWDLDASARLVVSLVYQVKATNRVAALEFEIGLEGEGVI